MSTLTEMYAIEEVKRERELKHWGILGMKWGVKHGPPYPLDRDVSTGSKLKRVRLDRGIDPKSPLSPESKTKTKLNNLRVQMEDMSVEEIKQVLNRLEVEIKVEKMYADEINKIADERKKKEAARWYKPENLKKTVNSILDSGQTIARGLDVANNFAKEFGGENIYEQFGLSGDIQLSGLFKTGGESKKDDKKE